MKIEIETSTIGAEMSKVDCQSYAELRTAGYDDLAAILLNKMSYTFPIYRDTSLTDCWSAGTPCESN